MALLDRIVCSWANFNGAPGYSSFMFSPAQGPVMQPRVVAFWTAVQAYLPTGYQITIPNNGTTVDEATGVLNNVWTGGTTTTVTGTGTGTFGPLSGAQVKWETGRIADGRHIRGRTFVVPLIDSTHSTAGLIGSTTANAINAAAVALIGGGGQLIVWHRPKYDNKVKPPTLVRPGLSFAVTSSSCPTKIAYLSSRRD